ncbi:S1C family serine protease [Alkalibacillus aidingensis]|uniref:S1C family serine protease n=1 Tax=Alkalibacillus aidingensis TaxID=2747607 RepID=UPI00166183F8|nr:trypsin-like peptidase domain-containing protein [Alkalibacillus aidingensis]
MSYQFKKLIPIAITALLVIAGIISLTSYYSNWQETALGSSDGIVEYVADEEAQEHDLQSIIHEAQKNVVQIESTGSSGSNQGSGFIYNDKGDIITNAHVVKNADSVYVKTSDAHTYPGAVIGIGNNEDVAVVRVPQLANHSSTLEIDVNFEPTIGDDIIAVGSPHGFQNTVTLGIVSNKGQSFTVDNYEYNDLYQISANITQGNSGGPLIHEETGKIIGINSAATTEGTIGFSIPISQVYDRVQMWSDTANDEELNYDGDPTSFHDLDPSTLRSDAEYLINYYYETLNVRDYFTAYSLLGSDPQMQMSYQDFRELIVSSTDIEITNKEVEEVEDNRVKISVYTDHQVRTDSETEETHHYKTEYKIGYENDQLKIVDLERELLSRTQNTDTDSDSES